MSSPNTTLPNPTPCLAVHPPKKSDKIDDIFDRSMRHVYVF